MTQTGWRSVDGVLSAWFDAASLVEGGALAGRVVELSPDVLADLRASGVRVRLGSGDHAEAVSAAARDLGLVANPAALQQLSVVLESANAYAVSPFWERALGYTAAEDGSGSADPLRRDPSLRLRPSGEARPLRNRIHLDVVRPSAVVEQAGLGDGSGPWGACHRDPDGNEVDLVPGNGLGDANDASDASDASGVAGTADWHVVFSAMACYRVGSPAQQRDVASAAAALADEAGFPLMVDLRPGLVILDSGKDLWDADAHGLDVTDLAGKVQTAARELGATADPQLPRFVQLFRDAADVDAVRAFRVGALGYVQDRRDGVSDIVDPRRLNPVLVFQQLDAADTERRRQRNRIHVELAVPADLAPSRVSAVIAAGGRLVEAEAGRWRVADPEGNELVLVSGA